MSHELRLTRLLDADPEVVFDAFTDPEAQREMYADEPDWIVESACDLRVGGRWSISFGPPGDNPALEMNVFEVVDRPRRLVYASTITMPDGTNVPTRVEVTLQPEGDGTRLTIVQSDIPTAERRAEFEGGWPSILDGLERVVSAHAGG
jgi:uncharacterized protein YndB with AHSA1/START domain